MGVAALFTWMVTILGGLFLLVIFIIEYDRDRRRSGVASRLPVPLISAHALLGMGGLVVWVAYLLLDREGLAWVTAADLGVVAVLGLTMAGRWLGVYRAFADPGPSMTRSAAVPPERNFPVPVVILHGLLAVTTLILVVLTVAGGS